MAYPTVSAPYGLKPVNLVGGLPFAGATREIPIASNYGTALFNGDVVQLKNDGTLIITTLQNQTTAVPGVVGVFLGCSYTSPALGYKLFSQYYPANTVASDIVAYVCDDPNALFKAVSVTSAVVNNATGGLLPAAVGRTLVGTNAELVLNTGLASTGNGRQGIYATGDTTNTKGFRIVDVVPDTATGADAYVELIVKFNAGHHSYTNAVGV